MKILVVNRARKLVQEFPNASIIKICDHPLEIASPHGANERLVVRRELEKSTIDYFLSVITDGHYYQELFRYYVEIENELPESLVMRISTIGDRTIMDPWVTLEKGIIFGGNRGVRISISGATIATQEDIQRMKDMLEMARFMAYEAT